MLQLILSAHDAWELSSPETVVVLPNGERRLTDVKQSHTIADLKRKIELEFGVPYELQKIRLAFSPQIISDWSQIAVVNQRNTEVLLQVDARWDAFINASLRGANEKVTGLLQAKRGDVQFENYLYVGVFLAVATNNERLWRYLLDLKPKIYKRSASGRNLLHVAVHARNLDCIECILEGTGQMLIGSKDNKEVSPLDLAKRISFTEAVTTFERYKETSESGQKNMGRPVSLSDVANQDGEPNSTKGPKGCYLRVNSTEKQKQLVTRPISPALVMDKSNLLDREKVNNSLKGHAVDNNLYGRSALRCVAQRNGLKNLELLNVTPAAAPNRNIQSAGANRKSSSVSAPVSPVTSPRNPEVVLSPSSIHSEPPIEGQDQSCGKTLNSDSLQNPMENQAIKQDVLLPPFERGSQNDLDNLGRVEVSDNQLDEASKMKAESHKENRRQIRSRSVATITPDELTAINESGRTRKPWNDWRRVSLVARNEREILVRQLQAARESERKKSFDSWLAEKDIIREELTTRMIKEEQMKKLEKEKLVEERKSRCKSYGSWLAEKEVEAGEVREAGKKKEIEKRSLEERMQIRKSEAERKYEKWMREKYEEELKKEEELQRLLEEKWKLKEKSKVRRKSAPVKTYNAIKQKSSKTQSLPVL